MGKFFDALMEQPAIDESIIDGVLEDDTQKPVKESAFAPVTEVEVQSMKTLLADMAAAEEIPGAVNRDAVGETKAKKITRIPIRKISGKDFFRIWSNRDYYRQNVRVIESRANAELALYLVSPKVELPPAIRKELKMANLYTGKSAAKDVFLLYIARSTTTWYDSAIEMMCAFGKCA